MQITIIMVFYHQQGIQTWILLASGWDDAMEIITMCRDY
jgi:hypothetical protein